MEDLQKTDPLYYEHIIVQNELHRLMCLVDEANISEGEKIRLREKTFMEFLRKAKEYKGCSGFENMTVEELKTEYGNFLNSLKKGEER